MIVEHNLDLVLALADRVFALERGAVIHQGPAAPLLTDLEYRSCGCGCIDIASASEAIQSSTKVKMDCFVAEPVIGRAFARPVGSRNVGTDFLVNIGAATMQSLTAAVIGLVALAASHARGGPEETIAVFTKNSTNPAYAAFRIAADQVAAPGAKPDRPLRSEEAGQCRRTEGLRRTGAEGQAGRRHLHSGRRCRHDRFGEEAQRGENPDRARLQSAARQLRHLCRRRRFRDRLPRKRTICSKSSAARARSS